jgi:methylenetetrahydrofolate reductase (NADPH)
MDSQKKHTRVFSCEFFPPSDDDGAIKLRQVSQRLNEALRPAFFSVTYGAGGSTRNRTFDAVLDIQQTTSIATAPHLTCVADTREGVGCILEYYKSNGIRRLVALRGDRPPGLGPGVYGDLRYANDLVAFIRAKTGDSFHIEVAAYPEFHPQAPTPQHDLINFKRKVDAGANSAITQYFYNADAYFRFIDSCQTLSIDIPIVPGIMPIINYKQLARFSDMCGAEIPQWMRRHLDAYGEDIGGIRAFGLDIVTALCQQLLDQGAPGLHFYSMNRAEPTLAICRNLGLLGHNKS